MIIQRISPTIGANHLYIFNNHNNIKNMAVTPIKPIKKLAAFDEERYRHAALYQEEEQRENTISSVEAKPINSIKAEYAFMENVSYNMENMYEREKMSAEASVLLGMNIDLFA